MDSSRKHQRRDDRSWYALYTRPRFEKRVDSLLKQKGIESFLPQRLVCRQWSNNRRRKISEPLFRSYVFVYGNRRETYESVQTYGVAAIVTFNSQPACIPKDQIESIRRALEDGYNVEPEDFFHCGDKVEIVSGTLQGIQGVLIERHGQTRLLISVGVIGQSVAIRVDKSQVRKLNSPKKGSRFD